MSISTTASAVRIQAFTTAANSLATCARDSPSERDNERLAYYEAAGGCYLEAQDLKNAGDTYSVAGQYPAAACAYREGRHFDDMVEVITQHKDAIDSVLIERLKLDAGYYYFKVCFQQSTRQ